MAFLFFTYIIKEITAKIIGKIRVKAKPILKLSPKRAAVCPVREGPTIQPKSPAKASIPNIITPPLGIFAQPRL